LTRSTIDYVSVVVCVGFFICLRDYVRTGCSWRKHDIVLNDNTVTFFRLLKEYFFIQAIMKLKLVENCITKPCNCLFILFMHLSLTVAVWNNYLGIKSNSWRFANVSQVKLMLEKTECLSMCELTVGCESVNHNSVTKTCELLYPDPWIPTDISATESNWTVYYKGLYSIVCIIF
jgi:hypothetical protein